jgi:hypothetical protein
MNTVRAMNKYDYVDVYTDVSKLLRTPKGALRLDAKAAYKEGEAMLTVYGFWADPAYLVARPLRTILHRMFVPRDTPKAEKRRMLQAMCDLLAVKHDTEYALRSKLQ